MNIGWAGKSGFGGVAGGGMFLPEETSEKANSRSAGLCRDCGAVVPVEWGHQDDVCCFRQSRGVSPVVLRNRFSAARMFLYPQSVRMRVIGWSVFSS